MATTTTTTEATAHDLEIERALRIRARVAATITGGDPVKSAAFFDQSAAAAVAGDPEIERALRIRARVARLINAA